MNKLRAASALLVLAAASLPAAASTKCKLLQFAQWPVSVERDRLMVEGSVNGRKVGVMLHTGTPHSLIRRNAADRLGLARQQPQGYESFGGAGEAPLQVAYVDELRIGDSVHRNWRLLVLDEPAYGDDVAIVIGYDLFRQADVEFDLANKAVRLYKAEDCANVALAYWAKGGADRVRLEGGDESIALPVRVNGKPARAGINSGAGASAVSRELAAAVGVTARTPDARTLVIGKRRLRSWISPFQSFAVGEETISNPSLHVADLDGPYMAGAFILRRDLEPVQLGVDFLRAHRLLVAHSQRLVYFTYAGGPVFTPQARPQPESAPRDASAPAR